MSIGTLMVHIDDTRSAAARVDAACNLAERFDATLIGIAACASEASLLDPLTVGAMVGEYSLLQRDTAETGLRSAERLFRNAADRSAARMEWCSAMTYPAGFIAEQSRRADLIVLGRRGASAPNNSVEPGDVLIRAGRPILLLPPDTQAPTGKNIVVAWKDTRESRRSVTDALPFLRRASRVSILTMPSPESESRWRRGAEDVVAFLGRHGIAATSVALGESSEPSATRSCNFAGEQDADLVVMGGYGRARAREWVFGGTTRGMLETATVACLMSH